MRGYLTGNPFSGKISGTDPMSGIYDGELPPPGPVPPVPSRGDHYTAQLNYTAVMTQVETKEVDT